MPAAFPSSRPNIGVRVIPKLPATMLGAGGIEIAKVGGVWTVRPNWNTLQLLTPTITLDPSTKETWIHDPVTDVYNRMTLGGLGQALFWGTSASTFSIGSGSKTFVTQSGKDWLPGMFVQAFSQAAPADFMIGQVTAYSGNNLTINVTSVAGAGNSHSDWTLVQSTLPGSGPPGSTGASAGLNYNYVFSSVNTGIDPGAGNFVFNSTTVASINTIAVSHTDRNALSLAAEIATWDDSTTVNNNARIRVYVPNDATKFIIATISGEQVNNGTWSTFALSNPTGPGIGANQTAQVEILRTGDKGTDGTTGAPGADGTGAGYRYKFNTSTSVADPGSGLLAFNNATLSSATTLSINETTQLSQNIGSLLNQLWTSSNPSLKATITIQTLTPSSTFAIFSVNANGTDNGTWDSIPVTFVSGGGTFTNNQDIQVLLSLTGNKGADGAGTIAGGANHAIAIMSTATAVSSSVLLGNNQILVGTAAADPVAATVSGDLTNSAGAFTIQNGAVTYAKEANLGPLAVKGRSANTSGVGADIQATAASDAVLRESGSTIGFGTVATAGISNNAITYAKMQDVSATSRVIGRITVGSGDPEELTGANITTIIGGNLSTLQSPGNWKILYSDGSAVLQTLALGAANTVLQGAGTTSAPVFSTKTLSIAHNLTIDTTDQTDTNPGSIYPGLPINSQSVAYTAVLGDANKVILHPVGDNNARTFTINSNASVAYPVGTTLTFINMINTLTIAITTDTLTLSSAGTTGSRTLAANGVATAVKITSTSWIISGTGLT